MSSFVEVQFPADISYGATFGPEFSTDVVITGSGYEQRNVNWLEARCHGDVSHGVKTQAQLDILIAFFRARMGKAYGFRFKDWSDYQVTLGAIGTGTGVAKTFQLVKVYESGGVIRTRVVSKPVAGTVKVYVSGAEVTAGWSVDTAIGLVTFSDPPGAGASVKASFEFDVPVRFDTDRMPVSIDNFNVYGWAGIPVIEVRI